MTPEKVPSIKIHPPSKKSLKKGKESAIKFMKEYLNQKLNFHQQIIKQ